MTHRVLSGAALLGMAWTAWAVLPPSQTEPVPKPPLPPRPTPIRNVNPPPKKPPGLPREQVPEVPPAAPTTAFRDCDQCPEMVVIPAGGFRMGSLGWAKADTRQYSVTIARAFAVGKYEVTFDEWDACVAAGTCSRKPEDNGWGRGRRPVIMVGWDDAQAYVAWLSKKTGKTYRLLTEAEWEYVARAGTTTLFPWGDEPGTNHANCVSCGSEWSGRKRTAPVGSFSPNAFGAYDMIGNVWEWVQDCWNESHDGAPEDGSAWLKGDCERRVLRGGSWFEVPQETRWNSAVTGGRGDRWGILGFRVARML